MAKRTGIVIATELIKGLCRVLSTWRPKIDATVAAAVSGGAITSAQAASLNSWLDLADGACTVIRVVSGY